MSRNRENYNLKSVGIQIIDPVNQYRYCYEEAKKQFETEYENKKKLSNSNLLKKNNSKINKHQKLSNSISICGYTPNIEKNLTIEQRVQEIRKKIKQQNKVKDPFEQALINSNIGYNNDNVKYVFETSKLLNKINQRKNKKLTDEDPKISQFIFDTQNISINNCILKVINNESENLYKNDEKNLMKLETLNKNYLIDEKNFNEFKDIQNQAYENIENILKSVEKKNRQLHEQLIDIKSQNKEIEDEMEKYFYEIENYRICAKFINKILDEDPKLFHRSIIQSQEEIKKNNIIINHIRILNEIFDDYDFVLNGKHSQNIFLNELLHDDSNIYRKFIDMQDKILLKLEEEEKILKHRTIDKKENVNMLKHLKIMVKFYEEEFNEKLEDYNKVQEEYNKTYKGPKNSLDMRNAALNIKDIQNFLNEENILIDININRRKKKDKKIFEIAKEIIDKIKEKETIINDLMFEMEEIEKNDNTLFNEILNERKIRNKENKQIEYKKNYEDEQNKKKIQAAKRYEKIIIKSRKTEPPYHHIKKKKKEIKKEDINNERKETDINDIL
jgi:hypothetical protein